MDRRLTAAGVVLRVLTASGDDLTDSSDRSRKMMGERAEAQTLQTEAGRMALQKASALQSNHA
jgi:hypothetical protein